ncbi:Hypothetical predicted protein [Mytilus galloprovincialis]|uniref:Zinc finger PHD-type domain-containing protein n=1 Tax=Mytilus galloprovincialis TaxID=29158 RepID=A0A8B6C9S3_MYTGA|nr:Hypothetical predicted protein [Mytilus galloprovincialis]
MTNKLFYGVARGVRPGIYALWSKCELNVHKFPHAVFKGFHTIDQAVAFLIAGNAFQNCHIIPVFDDTETTKYPIDYEHECKNPPCSVETIDVSIINENEDNDENNNDTCSTKKTTPQDQIEKDNLIDSTIHTQDIFIQSEDTVPKEIKSQSESLEINKIACTQLCNDNQNAFMIQCCKCQLWTHYKCTRLPVYQIFLLTSTSRRYNCETCTTVPPYFLEKCKGSFVQIQGQGDDKEINRHSDTTENDRTLEILDIIENSVVDAITKTHEKNQDDMIIQLKLDLQNERNHKEHMSEISKKFEEVKGTISTASSEIKSEIKNIMKEEYDKVSTKTINQIRDFTEKLNKNVNENISKTLQNKIDPIAETLQKINENSITATKALEVTGTKLSDNTRTNREITKTLENIAKTLNLDKQYPSANSSNNPAKRKSNHSEGSIPNIEVSNRFSPIADVDERGQTGNSQFQHESSYVPETKKALILGNSHVRYIRLDNFLQGCTVHKYTSYSMSEMEEKLHELDTDYDCIFFHVYTNDIRAETPDVFIQKLELFCQKLKDHCSFAKLIISLPFLSVKDSDLNQKILQSNILTQYKFLKSSEVLICENSVFSSRDQAVRRFFISDGLHLSKQGTSLFVTNMKFWLRKALNIKIEKSKHSYRNLNVQNHYDSSQNHYVGSRSNGRYMYDTHDRFNNREFTHDRYNREFTNAGHNAYW